MLETVRFNRIIGENACVDLDPGATAMFAVRKGRDVPTHVTLEKAKKSTEKFTVIAFKKGEDWELITGFADPSAPREPHDKFFSDPANQAAFEEALEFWSTHALVWEEAIMAAPYESTWEIELEKIRATRASG